MQKSKRNEACGWIQYTFMKIKFGEPWENFFPLHWFFFGLWNFKREEKWENLTAFEEASFIQLLFCMWLDTEQKKKVNEATLLAILDWSLRNQM